jgi:hypothetical protein
LYFVSIFRSTCELSYDYKLRFYDSPTYYSPSRNIHSPLSEVHFVKVSLFKPALKPEQDQLTARRENSAVGSEQPLCPALRFLVLPLIASRQNFPFFTPQSVNECVTAVDPVPPPCYPDIEIRQTTKMRYVLVTGGVISGISTPHHHCRI